MPDFAAELRTLYRSLPQPDDFIKEESELAGLACKAGVYCLMAGDRVVYVGQSKHVRNRLAQHRQEGAKAFDGVRVYLLEDVSSRLILEAILILLFLPRHNRGLNLGLADGRAWAIRWKK